MLIDYKEKKMENKTETIRFRVSERDVRRIDTLAEQTGHSRSSLLRALIWAAEPANVRPLQVEELRHRVERTLNTYVPED